MTEFLIYTGIAFWLAIGLSALILVLLFILDGVECAIFIRRQQTILRHYHEDPRTIGEQVSLWWLYFTKGILRPNYSYYVDDEDREVKAYWPKIIDKIFPWF